MRGLDTNVLLRFITADDPAQAERVGALFDAAERSGDRFFVSAIVLCELTWTLRGRPYGLDHDQIAAVVERILGTNLLEVQDRSLVRHALLDYRQGRGDFADYLLGRQGFAAGCADTITFDRKLSGTAGFSVIS
ncbi:MAG TPA: type II toxin-antitoxin system VapC family toxin [Thermoanaerobaculia bacterium]|nr:type II toxin-antitoxin system VapC family toxin [Thermoanaerobaculia bacterium]